MFHRSFFDNIHTACLLPLSLFFFLPLPSSAGLDANPALYVSMFYQHAIKIDSPAAAAAANAASWSQIFMVFLFTSACLCNKVGEKQSAG